MKLRYKLLIGTIALWFVLAVCSFHNPKPPGTPEAIGYAFGYLIFGPPIWGTIFWLGGLCVVMPVRWVFSKVK